MMVMCVSIYIYISYIYIYIYIYVYIYIYRLLRTNTVQHTECVQVNMSLDVTGNILDQQALSLELLSNSTKGAHSISCNRLTTELPESFHGSGAVILEASR